MKRRLLALLLVAMLLIGQAFAEVLVEDDLALSDEWLVEYGCDYCSQGEVALYLYAFHELPPNYMTKDEAREFGWRSRDGNLWDVFPGAAIGGDEFGNREGLLPEAKGRRWYECDVNYKGGYRGSERLLFASDGLIYYSKDHYETFELLYEDWYDVDYEYGREAARQ